MAQPGKAAAAGRLIRVLPVLFAVFLLVACGSSDGGPPNADPEPESGNLAVEISGLPAGAAAQVNVIGPDGYSRILTETSSLSGLTPGNYIIAAHAVIHEGNAYEAAVDGSPAAVIAGGNAFAQVTYSFAKAAPVPEPGLGNLAVSIAGLPAGVDASVTVTGPDGYSRSLTGSTTLENLVPGDYTVTAAQASRGNRRYGAAVTGSPATVTEGGTALASVTYSENTPGPGPGPGPSPTTGRLALNVTGVPAGTAAAITVSGPGGYSRELDATSTLRSLSPGAYAVAASDVTHEDDTYSATIKGSPASVTAGGTATVTVSYAMHDAVDPTAVGSLAVLVEGLPGGVPADVRVTGPGGFSETLEHSTTFDGLIPGNYEITAQAVTGGGSDYVPQVDGSPVLVLPEDTATAAVTYFRFAPDDYDAASNPGVHARFRPTSGGPVTVTEPLFNKGSPVDVKGIQYRKSLSRPGNLADWLAFEMQFGQGTTATFRVSLDCSNTIPAENNGIRAQLFDSNSNRVHRGVFCGDSANIKLDSRDGKHYVFEIASNRNDPFYTDYVLSIDAFCTQGCDWQAY